MIVLLLVALSSTPLADAAARIDASTFQNLEQRIVDRIPNRSDRVAVAGCLAFNLGANAFDATTTIRAIRSGRFHEANPALAWIGDEPERLIPVKAAYVAGLTWLVWKVARRHPKLAAAAGCTSGAVSAWAGASNTVQLFRQQ